MWHWRGMWRILTHDVRISLTRIVTTFNADCGNFFDAKCNNANCYIPRLSLNKTGTVFVWFLVTCPWSNSNVSRPGYNSAVVAGAPNTTARDQCMTKLKMAWSSARANVSLIDGGGSENNASFQLQPQADHCMCSWLINMKRTESIRVMNKALKIAYLIVTVNFYNSKWFCICYWGYKSIFYFFTTFETFVIKLRLIHLAGLTVVNKEVAPSLICLFVFAIWLFKGRSWCFPRLRLGKHEEPQENKTNCFPQDHTLSAQCNNPFDKLLLVELKLHFYSMCAGG